MKEIASEHFVGKVASKAIITRGNEVLIAFCNTRNPNKLWDIPGGRVHHGEKPEGAVVREVMEELGVSIQVNSIILMEQFLHSEGPTLLIAYEAELTNPEMPFGLPTDEIDEVRWITKDQLSEQKIFPVCLLALETYFKRKTAT
ncbi:MAG: NUDIX domain-containing protein [Candidatus Pacebacteria bacterium]|nr:NUDIX domain-containing protein [Candidatus Paceibacterota bacterium]MBP9832315.1 NUDIX domain-containing protein [Candidatus Paceibacterota bacterium]